MWIELRFHSYKLTKAPTPYPSTKTKSSSNIPKKYNPLIYPKAPFPTLNYLLYYTNFPLPFTLKYHQFTKYAIPIQETIKTISVIVKNR